MKNNGRLHFTKMTGTGNDFLIFDAREKNFPEFDRSLLAKTICRRTFSVGADGAIFIEKSNKPHVAYKWDFYNADGSVAEMCGNAARCVARFALEKNIADKSASFETLSGIVNTRVLSSGSVEVDMPVPRTIVRALEIPLGDLSKVRVFYVNAGVPHAVVENTDWDGQYLSEVGSYLRHHDAFKKTNGANVTFVEQKSETVLHAATFERGVEEVTMACGTGAVAAAAHFALVGLKGPFEVNMPGGVLHVDIDEKLSYAKLAGEARFICEGELWPEALL